MELSEVSTLDSVAAVSLAYFLDMRESFMAELGDQWEKGLLDDVQAKAEIYAPDLKVQQIMGTSYT